MGKYGPRLKLAEDESVIYKVENASYGVFGTSINTIVLTNQNFIYVKKGLFGDSVKDVLYFPLSDVSQAVAGRCSRSGFPNLSLYMRNGDIEEFSVCSPLSAKSDVNKLAKEIDNLLKPKKQTVAKNRVEYNPEVGYNPTAYAIPGTEELAQTVKGTIDTVKDIFGWKTTQEIQELRRAVFCQSCGANYEAIRGRVGTCPYCGAKQNIN